MLAVYLARLELRAVLHELLPVRDPEERAHLTAASVTATLRGGVTSARDAGGPTPGSATPSPKDGCPGRACRSPST